MKSFTQILNESKKTYQFKIGVAGPLPEEFEDHMETALKKFSIVDISSGKKTPIQERPLDFPNLQNMEVTYFEAELEYPTTPQVLQEYLGRVCSVPHSNIMVRNPEEPLELYQNQDDDKIYEPLITKDDLGGESAQQSVGENRVMDLLKELEIARNERNATQEK